MKKIDKKFNLIIILIGVLFAIVTYLWNEKKWLDQRIILENSSSFEIKVNSSRNNRNSLVLNDSIFFYKCGTEEILLKSSTEFINTVSKIKNRAHLILPPYILKKDKGTDLLIIISNENDSFFCKICD